MNILYVASEAYPFVSVGGLAEVAGSLPRAVSELGQDVRLMIPLYGSIFADFRTQLRFLRNITFSVSFTQYSCGLYTLCYDGLTVYFVENSDYFDRDCIYGDPDDSNRFAFFSKAVVSLLPVLEEVEHWQPDILHCNDWQTALISIYLREARMDDPDYPPIKVVYSIHNAEYPIVTDISRLGNDFGLSSVLFAEGIIEFDGHIDLMKGALLCSDAVTTFSPTYAKELLSSNSAFLLSPVIRAHQDKLHGILNGIDPVRRDPSRCSHLVHTYSVDALEGRLDNKRYLQQKLGLTVSDDIPLLACISRLLPRKGYGLLLQILPQLMELGVQVVILGAGSKMLERQLGAFSDQYPQQYRLLISEYDETLADQIYGACDLFLAPSQSEPCGLPAMSAMHYGAVPVVRATGGLKDTVVPYNAEDGTGYGFTFQAYQADQFLAAIQTALAVYRQKDIWTALIRRCMQHDFTWKKSAQAYLDLYQSLL